MPPALYIRVRPLVHLRQRTGLEKKLCFTGLEIRTAQPTVYVTLVPFVRLIFGNMYNAARFDVLTAVLLGN